MTVRHLRRLQDLSDETLRRLLDRARAFRDDPRAPCLAGRRLGMIFFDPSLRTRVSFQVAMADLGGTSIVLDVGGGVWNLETREGVVMDGDAPEHIRDAVQVLSRYLDALAVRAFPRGSDWPSARADPILSSFLAHATVGVINMESALYHPCQALADLRTIEDHLGSIAGRRIALCWAWHPKALPLAVPHSFALAVSRLGADLTIVAPEGYDLDPEIDEQVRANAAASGGSVERRFDRDGVEGAEVLFVKSWGSLADFGDPEAEAARRADLREWIVDRDLHARTQRALVMHCLPVRRNVVIADDVLDGPASVVYDQAENRLHGQKAILEWLLEEEDRS
jgi:N-acetylornithine carbamoyltransferase